jgi:anti-anti-sigma factor
MSLSVSSRLEGNVAVLELDGSLTLGPSLSTLRQTATQTLNESKLEGMILHVGRVTTADSAGLGELTVVYTLAIQRRCPIMLVEVSPTLEKMLEVTRLDALLPSAPDLAAAKKQLMAR